MPRGGFQAPNHAWTRGRNGPFGLQGRDEGASVCVPVRRSSRFVRFFVASAIVVLTLGAGSGASAGPDDFVVRFFNVAPRGGTLNSADSVVAEEVGTQEVLYSLTNLMFRVQSYEPIPFQLAETAAELAPLQGDLVVRIDQELKQAGFTEPSVKNFVFYNGSLGAGRIDGRGLEGGSTGMVWFARVHRPDVVVHELFHTFGLVPSCAPHASASFHVLDDANDLMADSEASLTGASENKVADVNHDDYFNPTLSSDGKTAVAIGSCPASRNLANIPYVTPGIFPNLHLSIIGHGALQIPNQQLCLSTCDYPKPVGTTYSLVALPDDGWHLSSWSGACSGRSACSVTMNAEKAATATFARNLVMVTVKVVGRGGVKGLLPAGAFCRRTCSRAVPVGANIHLSAIPAKGWKFSGWRGCSAKCSFPASRRTVSASFTQ